MADIGEITREIEVVPITAPIRENPSVPALPVVEPAPSTPVETPAEEPVPV